MKTTNEDIIKMQVICNIQAMEKAITGKEPTYEQLKHYTYNELHNMEVNLLKAYNKASCRD